MGLFVYLVLAGLALGCAGEEAPPANDAAPWHGEVAPTDPVAVERLSHYVPMRDGTRIAVDVYLPGERDHDDRFPTVIHQTRYWRAVELRWPLSALGDAPSARAEAYVPRGFALVSVDARGSGASFGTRPYPWSREERLDGAELAAWVVAQPWSDGRLAAEGNSYEGTAAEHLVAAAPAGLRAAAPRYSTFDGYRDVGYPGGVPLIHFLDVWFDASLALDAGRLPSLAGFLPRLMVRGVRPVDPDLLAAALRDHASNGDVRDSIGRSEHRDDRLPDGRTVLDISPSGHREALIASRVPLYSWSGWFDGGFARAAIWRWHRVPTPGSRLLLGPWSHDGRFSGSPTGGGPSAFDHDAELARFFDHHVRGRATGIAEQPPVLYYTMVEDAWKQAASWPPASSPVALHLAEGRTLARDAPRTASATDTYAVDFTATTGGTSRWDAVMTPERFGYPDRAAPDEKLLVYTSAALDAPLEVTGHPLVHLHIASDATDGAFFAYLEDVGPDGSVTHVTEGVLRALHRATQAGPSPLGPGIPHRSYARADARPLVPGEVTELVFDLLPTSWLFRRGHSIRLALAGTDADHFARIPTDGPATWTLHRTPTHPSRLVLPVVDD